MALGIICQDVTPAPAAPSITSLDCADCEQGKRCEACIRAAGRDRWHARHKANGGLSRAERSAQLRAASGRWEPRDCAHCAVSFVPKRPERATFCSRECAFDQRRAQSLSIDRRPQQSKVYFKSCHVCLRLFAARHPDTARCSSECTKAKARDHAKAKAKMAAGIKPARACVECATVFVSEYGVKRRRFYSTVCLDRNVRRVGKLVRKARARLGASERVDPMLVFDRDAWTCQQCRVKTPRKARGTLADNAPELDHIIPLAAGGEHSYRNTQCLCRKCNGEKGATPLGQMRLFG